MKRHQLAVAGNDLRITEV